MFEEAHEKLDALRRVFAGEASPVEAERIAAHLASCRECWLLANRAIAAQKACGGVASQGPLGPLVELHEMEQARLGEWIEAYAAWTELKSLPAKARRDKVRLSRTLHNLGFLEVLLEAAASASPAEGEELFYLALLTSQRLPSLRVSDELKADLCAECCSEIANARRRMGKWSAARDALNKANEYVRKASGNEVVEGKVLCVAGALEDDMGNTEEAAGTLWRAVGIFKTSAQTFLLSRTLTQLAFILVNENPANGLHIVEEALSLIPPNNPRLVLFAETTKIDCLIGIGAAQEALIRFKAIKALQEQFREPYVQVRRRFTAAKIMEHLGHTKKASALFEDVIADELENGLIKDFFLDLVYLFGFYIRRGQISEAAAVCRRAGQELSLLDDEEGSTEPAREQMRMVWRKLEEEVKRGNIELGATRELRNYVRSHWRFPASAPPFFKENEDI